VIRLHPRPRCRMLDWSRKARAAVDPYGVTIGRRGAWRTPAPNVL